MRLCLSSVETSMENALSMSHASVPSVLTSFYYAEKVSRTMRGRVWRAALQQASFRLCDSGAFTFRAGKGVGSTNLDGFRADYLRWLRAHTSLVDYWIELDVATTTGKEWVEETRAKFIEAGLGHGLVQVWHSNEHTWDDWIALLEESRRPGRSRFVAIEGKGAGGTMNYPAFLREAYLRGVRVHGFRMTDFRDLKRMPFYSVDSTSWYAPATYGVRAILDAEGWPSSIARGSKSVREGAEEIWKGRMPRKGTTFPTRLDMLTAIARAWAEAEVRITEYWRRRGVDWEARLEETA